MRDTVRMWWGTRVLGTLVGLLPVEARAADDQVTVLSWVAQARAALAPETRREERTLDFGTVVELVNQPPVRTDVHPHGPAGLDVHTAPGRWDEATVRCDGSPGVRTGRFTDGRATVRGLPEDSECRLVLSGGERPARLELVAGRTDAQVEIPVRLRRSRRVPPSR